MRVVSIVRAGASGAHEIQDRSGSFKKQSSGECLRCSVLRCWQRSSGSVPLKCSPKQHSTWLFERKLDNAKPCGSAIPLCAVEEFDLPDEIIDRKVRNVKMIPLNREVDIRLILGYDDNATSAYRRGVFDAFLRNKYGLAHPCEWSRPEN